MENLCGSLLPEQQGEDCPTSACALLLGWFAHDFWCLFYISHTSAWFGHGAEEEFLHWKVRKWTSHCKVLCKAANYCQERSESSHERRNNPNAQRKAMLLWAIPEVSPAALHGSPLPLTAPLCALALSCQAGHVFLTHLSLCSSWMYDFFHLALAVTRDSSTAIERNAKCCTSLVLLPSWSHK